MVNIRESPGTKGRMENGNGAKVGGKEGDKVRLGPQVEALRLCSSNHVRSRKAEIITFNFSVLHNPI